MKRSLLRIEFDRRKLLIGLPLLLVGALAVNVIPSTLTLTTIYPAPSGVYKTLITTGGTTASPRDTVLLRDAGNLGIGTTSTSAKLTLLSANTGAAQTNAGAAILQALDGNSRPAIAAFGNIDGTGFPDAVASAVQIRQQSGTGRSLTMAGSLASGAGGYFLGNVGVGTSAPATKLDVNGSANIGNGQWLMFGAGVGGAAADSGIDFGFGSQITRRSVDGHIRYASQNSNHEFLGNITASAFFYSSDARLKSDVRTIPRALEKLLAIRGVGFRWKDSKKRGVGVLAQDVERAFPELVAEDKEGMKSVEYGNLVGPMIEAIRELKAKTDLLERQVQSLRIENKRLRGARP